MSTKIKTNITKNVGMKIGSGIVFVHTDRGLDRLKKTATQLNNPLKIIGSIGVGVVGVTALLSVLLFVVSTFNSVGSSPTAANEPKNALLIPGINDFLPLGAALDVLLVLLVSVTIHEVGHAILAFREGYDVEEWGVVLLLGVIPIGAYVKIPEEQIEDGPVWSSLRVLAAGVVCNYLLFAGSIIAVIALGIPIGDGVQYYLQVLPSISDPGAISLTTSIAFWMVFLNINLAAINSLPIYGLDGGVMLGRVVKNTSVVYSVSGVVGVVVLAMYVTPYIL